MVRVRAVLGLVGALALARGASAEPEATPFEQLIRRLDRVRAEGGADPAAAQEVAGLVATVASTPDGVAALIESGRFEVKLPVGAKVKWTGGEAGVELVRGGASVSLPLAPLTSLQASVGERKLGVGTSTQVLDFRGTEVKVGGGVEAEYATNKDFYAALPVPGLRHMHALLESRLGESGGDAEARVEGGGAREALEAAAREAGDAFKSAVGWVAPKQATFQSSVSVSHGPVEVTAAQNVQVSFQDPGQLLRQTGDVTFKVSQEAAFGTASVGAGLAFTYKADDQAQPTPEMLDLAAAIRSGDAERVAESVLVNLGPVALNEADLALAKEVYEKGKDAASLATGQVLGTVDPIGGVSLHFSPSLTGPGATPAAYGRALREISRLRREGRTAFAVQEGGTSSLVRVPLERAVQEPDLGLTRVRGWVQANDGTIALLGEREEHRAPVPRDHLVVALRAIYLEGLAPFVSLDPDPRNFAGAQKARVGGLPAGLEDTTFTKVLLDADHLMKRLDLGELVVGLPEYRSTAALLETWPDPPAELTSRLWLVPEVAPVGDAYEHQDERGRCVLFHSRIRVLTETLKRAGGSLLGVGATHPLSEAAAASLSANLPSLATIPACSAFADLEQVFDVAKLCALWRAGGVKAPSIARLAALTPGKVPHPSIYAGIGPISVRGGTYALSGGAQAKARLRARKPHPLPALAGLLTASTGDVALPDALPLDGSELAQANAELLANAALQDVLEGRYAPARDALDRALAQEPDLDVAYAYRALAHLALGDVGAARKDVETALRTEPSLGALQAVIEATGGRTKEALAACDAVEARFPEDTDVLSVSAHARLLAGDFEGCDAAARKVDAALPLSHDALALRDQVASIWRDTPEGAARYVAYLRDVPLAVQNGVATGQEAMASFGFVEAVQQFRTARTAALADPRPQVRAHHVPELCTYLLVNALQAAATFHKRLDPDAAERETQEAAALARELHDAHPEWPSLALLRARMGGEGLTTKDRIDLFERAVAAEEAGAASDPLHAQLRRGLGTRRIAALFLVGVMFDKSLDGASDEEGLRAVGLLVRALGDTPEAKPFRLLWEEAKRSIAAKERDPGPEAMRAFAEAILAVPQPWSDDPVSAMSLAFLHMMGLGMTGGMDRGGEERAGPNADLAPRFLQRFLTGCRVNGLREGSLKQVATVYWVMAMALGSRFSEDLQKSPRFQALVKRVEAEVPDLAALRAELAALRAEHRERLAEDVTPFAAALADALAFLGSDGPETALREAFAGALERLPDPEHARELLAAWANDAQERLRSDEGFAGIAAVAERATSEVELAAVLNMLDVFGMAADVASGSGESQAVEMAGRLRALKQAVNGRIKGQVFSRPAHDWAAWRGNRAPRQPAPAGGAASPDAEATGLPWTVWIGVGGLAAVAALLVLRRRTG